MDAAKSTKPYRIGFLPFASYNDDQGLAYGFVLQLDDQRPGEFSPYYLSHRLTIKRTTRGIGDYNYRLDSKYLLPAELRLTLGSAPIPAFLSPTTVPAAPGPITMRPLSTKVRPIIGSGFITCMQSDI